jgi:single-stranded DNA-binding protein
MYVIITGNVGTVFPLQQTEKTSVLNFKFAADRSFYLQKKTGERADWMRVAVFGNQAEALAKMLEKGRLLKIRGELYLEEYKKEQQLQLQADDVRLLGSNGKRDPQCEMDF